MDNKFSAGPQSSIEGSDYRVGFQKNLDKKVGNLGGGFNEKSGTRKADFKTAPSEIADWQGVKGGGKSKHTYSVNGKND